MELFHSSSCTDIVVHFNFASCLNSHQLANCGHQFIDPIIEPLVSCTKLLVRATESLVGFTEPRGGFTELVGNLVEPPPGFRRQLRNELLEGDLALSQTSTICSRRSNLSPCVFAGMNRLSHARIPSPRARLQSGYTIGSVKRILFIFGTRPEAIKLCPVIRRVREASDGLQALACVTAQHRHMLDQVLDCFELQPDYDLNLMTPGQTLAQTTSRVLASLDPILAAEKFDMAVVQGDTTTTMAGAMAAFYRGIPVAHVEAGLRTGDMAAPFPEEMNRVVTGRLAALHHAPTEGSRQNLLAEGVPSDRIYVTGNTGIDAVLYIANALEHGTISVPAWEGLDATKKLVVVTAHRRESFGDGIDQICEALAASGRTRRCADCLSRAPESQRARAGDASIGRFV